MKEIKAQLQVLSILFEEYEKKHKELERKHIDLIRKIKEKAGKK
jgi:hypothetical protein